MKIDISYLSEPRDFEVLYEALSNAYDRGYHGILAIDLSDCRFIAVPGHMALITAGRFWHQLTGQPISLMNIAPDIHAYIDRMLILDRCSKYIQIAEDLTLEKGFLRSAATVKLLEVTSIASEVKKNVCDVEAVVRQANRILHTWFPNSEERVGGLLTVLAAITENVVHSQDQGFVMIQRYQTLGDALGSRVDIVITDLGIGIEESLRPRVETMSVPERQLLFPKGSDYLIYALKQGVSRRATGGGMGLHQVKELVGQWHGQLLIRSLASKISIDERGTVIQEDLLTYVPGTQVVFRVWGSWLASDMALC